MAKLSVILKQVMKYLDISKLMRIYYNFLYGLGRYNDDGSEKLDECLVWLVTVSAQQIVMYVSRYVQWCFHGCCFLGRSTDDVTVLPVRIVVI
jgi:hypothetical protein